MIKVSIPDTNLQELQVEYDTTPCNSDNLRYNYPTKIFERPPTQQLIRFQDRTVYDAPEQLFVVELPWTYQVICQMQATSRSSRRWRTLAIMGASQPIESVKESSLFALPLPHCNGIYTCDYSYRDDPIDSVNAYWEGLNIYDFTHNGQVIFGLDSTYWVLSKWEELSLEDFLALAQAKSIRLNLRKICQDTLWFPRIA